MLANLGVPLFQEQVATKLAVVAAACTPARPTSFAAIWPRGATRSASKHRERLISRMEEKGITRQFGERVFSRSASFSEYGFPETWSRFDARHRYWKPGDG